MADFFKILTKIEAVLAALAYVLVASLLLGEVVAREVFTTSIWGSQKIAVFAAIVAGFFGLALATASNSHLRPQFADGWWPSDLRPAISRIGDGLSALLFAALGVVAAFYLHDTIANGDRAAVLYWPLWPIQLVLPYAFFSCAFRHLGFAAWPALKPRDDVVDR